MFILLLFLVLDFALLKGLLPSSTFLFLQQAILIGPSSNKDYAIINFEGSQNRSFCWKMEHCLIGPHFIYEKGEYFEQNIWDKNVVLFMTSWRKILGKIKNQI